MCRGPLFPSCRYLLIFFPYPSRTFPERLNYPSFFRVPSFSGAPMILFFSFVPALLSANMIPTPRVYNFPATDYVSTVLYSLDKNFSPTERDFPFFKNGMRLLSPIWSPDLLFNLRIFDLARLQANVWSLPFSFIKKRRSIKVHM